MELGTPREMTTLESGVGKTLFSMGHLVTKAEEVAKDHVGAVTGAGQLPHRDVNGNAVF